VPPPSSTGSIVCVCVIDLFSSIYVEIVNPVD
jgi:hypothetical protein